VKDYSLPMCNYYIGIDYWHDVQLIYYSTLFLKFKKQKLWSNTLNK